MKPSIQNSTHTPANTVPATMKGVFAAVLTPLNSDNSPDLGRLVDHCHWLLENGCDGLAVMGTTGEGPSFGLKERIAILEGLAKAGIDMAKTMPGTGAAALSDTVEITRCAVDVGAGGVLVLPPFYFKGVTDQGVFDAYAEIIERVASPQLRLYLYNIPQISGVPISHDVIDQLIRQFPQSVVGIKDSSGVEQNMLEMVQKFPGFAVFSGSETSFLNVMKVGGAGCITAISNISCALAQRVTTAWFDHQTLDHEAQEAHDILQKLRVIISKYPLQASLKYIIADHYKDDGWLALRPPLTQLKDSEKTDLMNQIQATGFKLPAP